MVDVSLAHGMENFPIEELELGVRSYNCLKRVGIETIGDLVTKTENELASIPNFGKKSIEEVKETLGQHGLRLRGDNGGPSLRALAGYAALGAQRTRSSVATRLTAGRCTPTSPPQLIEHERIRTTVTKAKAVKPIAEQMITLGRRGDMHARRQAVAFLARRTSSTSCSPSSARATPSGPAATRGSSASGRARATPPRWSTSSSSTRRSSSRRACPRKARRPRRTESRPAEAEDRAVEEARSPTTAEAEEPGSDRRGRGPWTRTVEGAAAAGRGGARRARGRDDRARREGGARPRRAEDGPPSTGS